MTENVYSKLQKSRVELQKRELKKSGKNTYAGYDYFELGDFMPHINEIFDELKLFGHVTFTPEYATLTVMNTEKPEETIVFTSPMAELNLKGAHAIQNTGAIQTYQRRYLYFTALEITEKDTLDATTGADQPTGRNDKPPRPDFASDAQVKKIHAVVSEIIKAKGDTATKDDIYEALRGQGYKFNEPKDILKSQASNVIKQLETWRDKAKG